MCHAALALLLLLAPAGAVASEAPAKAAAPAAAAAKGADATRPAAAVKVDEAPGKAVPTEAAAKEAAAKLTADTIATAAKPKGFRYSILRDMWVDDVTETTLHVKRGKKANTSRAVPIPKDRKLLDTCIAGGTHADLKRGATVTVKFDPKGVVRPEIILSKKVALEVLRGKVLDIGGPKLYVALEDGAKRGFAVEKYADWDAVVRNGGKHQLVKGAKITVKFDPSGEKGLEIVLDDPSAGAHQRPDDSGCGCSTAPRSALPSSGVLLVLLLCVGALVQRRTRYV